MLHQTQSADILDGAGDFLTTGLVDENTPALQRLSLECYRALATGEPATLGGLAKRVGSSESDVATLLTAHQPSTIDRDDDGAIVAFNGLSLIAIVHRFEVDGHSLYTWCVFDALFLPQVLGKTAKLTTRCPITGAKITVEIANDQLEHVNPAGIVMSMVGPGRQACCDNVRGAFCDRVSFFRDCDAFARATDGRADVIGLDAEEAMALAIRCNKLRYPDLELWTTAVSP